MPSNKHKKCSDWGHRDDIWDNCGVLTLKKGREEECEEIIIENKGLIIGEEREERVKISWHSTNKRDARNK